MEISCTTDGWKRLGWTACRSTKLARTHSESQWSARSIREFTPVQENSNEDEPAGLSNWLPDSSEHDAGRDPGDSSRPGARWSQHERSGDLKRGDYASATASRNPRGRSGKAGRTRGTYAESGTIGAGFRQRDDGCAEDVVYHPVAT